MARMHGRERALTHTHTHTHTRTSQACLNLDAHSTNRLRVSNEINLRVILIVNFFFRIILSYFIQWPLSAPTDNIMVTRQHLKELDYNTCFKRVFTFVTFIPSDLKATLRDGMMK